jgi:hypothetical protein
LSIICTAGGPVDGGQPLFETLRRGAAYKVSKQLLILNGGLKDEQGKINLMPGLRSSSRSAASLNGAVSVDFNGSAATVPGMTRNSPVGPASGREMRNHNYWAWT